MFGSKINAIDYRSLPTFDIEIIKPIQQQPFVGREILYAKNDTSATTSTIVVELRRCPRFTGLLLPMKA